MHCYDTNYAISRESFWLYRTVWFCLLKWRDQKCFSPLPNACRLNMWKCEEFFWIIIKTNWNFHYISFHLYLRLLTMDIIIFNLFFRWCACAGVVSCPFFRFVNSEIHSWSRRQELVRAPLVTVLISVPSEFESIHAKKVLH